MQTQAETNGFFYGKLDKKQNQADKIYAECQQHEALHSINSLHKSV